MQLEIQFPSKFRAQRTFRRILIAGWFRRDREPLRYSWNEIRDYLVNRRRINLF